MKLARIPVTLELLAEVLQLPAGVRIQRVIAGDVRSHLPRTCELVLEGEDLPVAEIDEGLPIPKIIAVIYRGADAAMVPRWTFTVVEPRGR